MSRIGKQPVTVPAGTTITVKDGLITVTGSKGTLEVPHFDGISVEASENLVVVAQTADNTQSFFGLQRTLVQNAITGVSEGWKRDLELHGVGMRAAVAGSSLTLNLGFSHPISFPAPEGIAFQVVKNVITVSGIDKQLVGEVAANIRKLRKPEPYKGKGIRYANEFIRRKAGKTGKAK